MSSEHHILTVAYAINFFAKAPSAVHMGKAMAFHYYAHLYVSPNVTHC